MNKTNLFASTNFRVLTPETTLKKQIWDTQKRTDMTLGIKKKKKTV